jgi:hypothetical protein
MKVYLGPYKNWIGPYQLTSFLKPIIGEDRTEKVGDWLNSTWVADFCQWVDSKRKRKISVRVDGYDVWGADHTLAFIIHPVLVELKKHKHGHPLVDDEDVPENIRCTSARPLTEDEKNRGCLDEFAEARWDWVLEEMIWAFEQHTMDDEWQTQYESGNHDFRVDEEGNFSVGPNHTYVADYEGIKKHRERMANGRRLFAKYYESLWD